MPEAFEVSAGRAGRVDVEVLLSPLDEEAFLTVRRFDHNEIKVLRIATVGEKERAIEEVDRFFGNDNGIIGGLEYGSVTGVLFAAPRFEEIGAGSEQADASLEFNGREVGVTGAAQ